MMTNTQGLPLLATPSLILAQPTYFVLPLRLLYPPSYEVAVTVGTTYVVRIPGVPNLIKLFDFAFKLVVEVVNWALACYQYYGVYIGNFPCVHGMDIDYGKGLACNHE
jgi:hypothetical protein